MNQQFQATYAHGVLRLDSPLPLPDNIRVSGIVTSTTEGGASKLAPSVDDFDRLLDELSLDVPPLPEDFSRADIYLDHD